MAGVGRPDVPFMEEQQGLSASIPASENLEANLESNLSACENSNTTYAAVAASAEAPRVNEDDTLVLRNYRNELFLERLSYDLEKCFW